MNEKMQELQEAVDCELVANHSMTIDEILECLHCGLDEDGEIIDLDTGKHTGIWYEEVLS